MLCGITIVIGVQVGMYTTLLPIHNVTYIICEGSELGAWKSINATSINCQRDIICQHKKLLELNNSL